MSTKSAKLDFTTAPMGVCAICERERSVLVPLHAAVCRWCWELRATIVVERNDTAVILRALSIVVTEILSRLPPELPVALPASQVVE